jgi:hypothetical protein
VKVVGDATLAMPFRLKSHYSSLTNMQRADSTPTYEIGLASLVSPFGRRSQLWQAALPYNESKSLILERDRRLAVNDYFQQHEVRQHYDEVAKVSQRRDIPPYTHPVPNIFDRLFAALRSAKQAKQPAEQCSAAKPTLATK